jgi:Ala-tRNA(Pro) deacylase
MQDTYSRFISFLDDHGAEYRLIDHAPEGRTEIVSPMRGNSLQQAAKCIVMMVKFGKKVTRYVLGVVPGDARVDLNLVRALLGGTYISFASPDIAERLAGSVTGTILPFSFVDELELIVDPSLLKNDEIYFNAARLDRSIVLKASDYTRLSKPRLEPIAEVRRATASG